MRRGVRVARAGVVRAFAILSLAASACMPSSGSAAAGASAKRTETITVFAAASLSEAFREVGAEFARAEGVRVRFNFAGSQQLVAQLSQGAGADVFAPADLRWMHEASHRRFVAGPVVAFASNRLVVVLPARNPARIARLADLARPGVKIVMASAAVPAGEYTREVLRRLDRRPGFPADFRNRVLANLVSEEDNVRGVLGKVQLGEADAGIVYASDVKDAPPGRVRELLIPADSNVLAYYPIAVVRASRHAAPARKFIEFVRSGAGQRILARHGFLPPPDAAP